MRLNCPALKFDILSKCMKHNQFWTMQANEISSRKQLFCVFDGRDLGC